MRHSDWTGSDFFGWARELFVNRGAEATLATLAISGLAILLAAAFAWWFAPFAARNLARRAELLGVEAREAQRAQLVERQISGV